MPRLNVTNKIKGLFFKNSRRGWFLKIFSITLIMRVVGLLLGFLVGVQLARGLGPTWYGIYGIAISLSALFLVPTQLGLPQLIMREVASVNKEAGRYLSRNMIAWSARIIAVNSSIIAIVAFTILHFNSGNMGEELQLAIIWSLIILPIWALMNVASGALRGLHKIVDGTISEILVKPGIMSLLLFLAFIYGGNTYFTPSIAMALNLVSFVVATLYVFWKLYPEIKTPNLEYISSLPNSYRIKNVIPLTVSEGIRVLSGHSAFLILGALVSAENVGIYRVAYAVWTVSTLPTALIGGSVAPMLTTLFKENKVQTLQRLNNWIMLFLTGAGLLAILPFLIAGNEIISFVFGEAYIDATFIILVLLTGELVAALFGNPHTLLNMLGHDKIVAKFSLISLIINISLSLLLVFNMGAVGVALGAVVGQITWRLLCSIYAKNKLGIHTTMLGWFS